MKKTLVRPTQMPSFRVTAHKTVVVSRGCPTIDFGDFCALIWNELRRRNLKKADRRTSSQDALATPAACKNRAAKMALTGGEVFG
jgi:hypothetical protein